MSIPNISLAPKDIADLAQLSEAYTASASILYANAYDISKTQLGQKSYLSGYYLIVSIYLLRHGLELAVKALYDETVILAQKPKNKFNKIKEKLVLLLYNFTKSRWGKVISSNHHKTHDIKKMWKKIPRRYSLDAEHTIDNAFETLAQLKILKDEELFRYMEKSSKGQKITSALHQISNIPKDDFENLLSAANAIHQIILEVSHEKKGLTFEPSYDRLSFPISQSNAKLHI